MASGSVIKEFLVSLGVQVDVKEFFTSVDLMTKTVAKFSLGLSGMITMLKGALIATASALEKLYYTAQRAGTSVDSLKMLQYGMAQIGLSAADASSALENLAMSMRLNPGNESLLRHLGVQTRMAGGAMRDTEAVMGDFVARLSKMPFYIAAQYAESFGINSRTLYMLLQNFGALQLKEREWRDMARATGVDLDDAAKKSRDFMNELRTVGEVVELMWIKVSAVLIQRLRPEIESLRKFLLEHNKEITDFAIQVGNSILNVGDDIVAMLPALDRLVKATIGWKDVLQVVADIIMYRIFGPLGFVASLLYQLWGKEQEAEKKNPGPGRNPDGTISKDAPATKQFVQQNHDMIEAFKRWLGEHVYPPLLHDYGDGGAPTPGQDGGNPPAAPNEWRAEPPLPWAGNSPAQSNRPSPQTAGNFEQTAFRPGDINGIGSALFSRLEAGFGLPAGLLDSVWKTESNRGRNMQSPAGAQGHFQFMPATAREYGLSDPNNLAQSARAAAAYLSDLLKHYGGNLAKALAGYNWGQGHLDKDVAQFGRDWLNHVPAETFAYLGKTLGGAAPGSSTSIQSKTGGNVNIQQKTDIHVHGADPHSTAKETGRQQEAVNADIVRRFRTAVLA